VGGARVCAGHATHLTVQRIRNNGAVSIVIEFEDSGATAKDADTTTDTETALNCWMPLDLLSRDTVPRRLSFNHD